MDLNKVNAGLRRYEEQAEADAAEAERLANRSTWERIVDGTGEVIDTVSEFGTNLVNAEINRANVNRQVAEDFSPAGELLIETAQDVYRAGSEAWDSFQNFQQAGRDAQAALYEGMRTGDYSGLDETIDNLHASGETMTGNLGALAASPFRASGRAFVDSFAEREGVFQETAQSMRQTNLFQDYFMTPAEKAKKAMEISALTGINADAILEDNEAFAGALKVYDLAKQIDAVGGDRGYLFEEFPELSESMKNMDKAESVTVLHNIEEVRTTKDIVETFNAMYEQGNVELELNNLYYKQMEGKATENDLKRINDLEWRKQNQKKQAPSFFDDPLLAIVGGVASNAPMIGSMLYESAEDAAMWAGAGAAAGAGFAGLGAGPGAAIGGAAGGIKGLGRAILTGGARREAVSAWLASGKAGRTISGITPQKAASYGARYGAWQSLGRMESGSNWKEYTDLKDEEGNRVFTDDEARGYAKLAGYISGGIELADAGMFLKAIAPKGQGARIVKDILTETGAIARRAEDVAGFTIKKAGEVGKITLAEAAEEAAQSASNDTIYNMALDDVGDTYNKRYTSSDILGRAVVSFAEAIPASIGYGLLSVGGGAPVQALRSARLQKKAAAFEEQYTKDQRETMTGTILLERLQQATSEGKLKETPEIQQTIMREQLKDTPYKNAYIDVEMALKKENGLQDLKEVAKSAGIKNEDLETAVQMGGHIMVPVERYAQSKASSDLLDSVSFSPEADSTARMRETARRIDKEATRLSREAVSDYVDNVVALVNRYYPEEAAARDPKIKAQREMFEAAVYHNTENIAEGYKALRQEVRGRLKEILKPAIDALRGGMKQGVDIIGIAEEYGSSVRYSRVTNNAKWYSDFYKEHGRAPRVQELEDMAIALVTNDSSAPKVEGWNTMQLTAAEGAEYAREGGLVRAEIEELQESMEALDAIRDRAERMTGQEMDHIKSLTPEGYEVYEKYKDALVEVGGASARAAGVSAAILARHADRYAEIIREKTDRKKYTAKDYVAESMGLDVTGTDAGLEAQYGDEIREYYEQAMHDVAKNGVDSILGFKEKIDERRKEGLPVNKIKYTNKETNISYPESQIVHIQSKHDISDEEMADLEKYGKTMEHVEVSDWKGKYGGISVLGIVKGDITEYGVIYEITRKGDIYFKTAFKNTERGLDQWLKDNKKEDAEGLFWIDKSLVSIGQPLDISSISKNLNFDNMHLLKGGKKERYNQTAWHGSPHVFDAFTLAADHIEAARVAREADAWAKVIDAYLKGDIAANTIPHIMGKPAVLSLIDGMPSAGIKIKQRTLKKILTSKESVSTHGHADEISHEIIKDLPRLLSEPVMVLRSRDNRTGENKLIENGYIFLVEAEDTEGNPVIVPIALEKTDGDYIVKSVYGKREADTYIKEKVKKGDLLYIDESKKNLLSAYHSARSNGAQESQKGDSFDLSIIPNRENVKTEKDLAKERRKQGKLNQNANGFMSKLPNGRRVVSLLESADESTFLHEMGHIFLMDLEDLANIDEAQAADLAKVREWAKWERGAAKEYKNTPFAREFNAREKAIIAAEDAGQVDEADRLKREWEQERFARAFELYLRDGKAPAKGLQRVFRQFKKFLRAVYEAFKGEGGRASQEIEAIMARMIATEDEIETARLDDAYKDIDKAGGKKLFDETEAETYARWEEEAAEEAKEKLLKETMKQLKEGKLQEVEELVVRERARKERELQNEPVYLVEKAIKNGAGKDFAKTKYPTVEDWEKERAQVPSLEEALDTYMEEYRAILDEATINEVLTQEEIDTAMQSTEARGKLEEYKAAAFEKRLNLVKRITKKTEKALEHLEDVAETLPEDIEVVVDKDTQPVKDLTDAVTKLRFSARFEPEMIEKIDKIIKRKTKKEVNEAVKEIKRELRERRRNEKEVEDATKGQYREYREFARNVMRHLPLNQAMFPHLFRNKVRKWAKEVQRMIRAERWDVAKSANRNRAMNAAQEIEAKKIREESDKLVNRVKRMVKSKQRMPVGHRYWVEHLAYKLRFTDTDAKKPEGQELIRLSELFEKLKAENIDVNMAPEDILNLESDIEDFTGWQSLNIEQLKQAVDTITVIYHTGVNDGKMKSIDGKDIDEVVGEILADSRAGSTYRRTTNPIGDERGGMFYNDKLSALGSIGEWLARKQQEYFSVQLNPETLLETLGESAYKYIYGIANRAAEDEGKRVPAATMAIKGIIDRWAAKKEAERKAAGENIEAIDQELEAEEAAIAEDLKEETGGIFHFDKKKRKRNREVRMLREKILWEEVNGNIPLTRENVIAMALNMGTEDNWSRLWNGLFAKREKAMRDAGMEWEKVQRERNAFADRAAAFVEEHMTKADWEMVQEIWDHLGSYWKEDAAVQEELTGVSPGKVQAKQRYVRLPDGKMYSLRGGYYPIKYAMDKSQIAGEQQKNEEVKRGMSGAQVLGTRQSATKQRSEFEIKRPLQLELSVLPTHLSDTIHRITHRIAVRDLYRILHHRDIEDHISATIGRPYLQLLTKWSEDLWGAAPEIKNATEQGIDNAVSYLTANSTMAIMGYRIWPVVENTSNIMPLMDRLGVVKGAAAIADFYKNRDEYMKLVEYSTFMKNRINSMDRDIRGQQGLFNQSAYPFEIMKEHAFDLMLFSDLMISMPLWVAEYKKHYEEKVVEVTRENRENEEMRAHMQAEIDRLKGELIDIQQDRQDPALDDGSPFSIQPRTEEEKRQEGGVKWKEIMEAEERYKKELEKPIYDANEIIDEARRRAVREADKAVRDVFGSGQTKDLSDVQRSKKPHIRAMTTLYSFFNAQMNAILRRYIQQKMNGGHVDAWSTFKAFAPVYRTLAFRIFGMSVVGYSLKFLFGLEGDDDKDKYRKVKDENGNEVREEIPLLERYVTGLLKYNLSSFSGMFIGARDIANLTISQVFDGTTYGRGMNPVSQILKGPEDIRQAITMLSNKGEKDLEIAEQEAKRAATQAEKLDKIAKKHGRNSTEYKDAVAKYEEAEKYRKPPVRITYSAILQKAAGGIATMTAANTGLTNTIVDAATRTLQYVNDTDNLYDPEWQNILWSAIWDKKPVEREIPKRPPAPKKETKNAKSKQGGKKKTAKEAGAEE